MADVLMPVWAVVVSTPALASVETTGLSTISTLGELPCCAASRTLLVSAVVSKPVRWTFTPALVPHLASRFTQADPAVNCGYGSQTVYVVGLPAAVFLPDEQAAMPQIGRASCRERV